MKQTIKRKIQPKLFISFSSYKTFKNCPEMYRQNYLVTQEEQEFVPFDSYEASVGTAVQGVFEHLINKNIDTSNLDRLYKKIDDDIIYLSDLLIPLKSYEFVNSKFYVEDNHIVTKFQHFAVDTKDSSLRQIRRKFVSEVATMYRKPLVKMSELYDLRKMSSEVKLQVEFKDFILGGRIDFIHYLEKSGIEILDGKRQYNPRWIDSEQVFMYGIMASKQLNKSVKKLNYWDWSTNKIHKVDFQQSDLDNTFKNIVAFKKKLDIAIAENSFRKKAGYHCRWCPIKDSCTKFNNIPTEKGEFESL